ncbi:Tubby protein [Hondaea fermentalgiana]|uniref:Tubby protein n=1 Tax=Hondaea fermentalgiana TaxID=2315210 RepID=A0A2R5GFA1_9STRA|nr:Tubby protein [Hondaea fermentalgiana]|eukprot:GBG26921.1 Tubby protein [Hondaea fermentalgiana]
MLKYRAMQAFQAEGPGELSVGAGELVMAQNNTPMDGWLEVKSLGSGQQGFVPFGYLEIAKPSDEGASAGYGQMPMPSQQQQPLQQQPQQQQAPPQAQYAPSGPPTNMPSLSTTTTSESADQFSAPPPALNAGLQQNGNNNGSLSSNSGANPFEQMSTLDAALPSSTSNDNKGARRHSYALSASSATSAGSRDQYNVTNPSQFKETLELWRERERRFQKGEPERLPVSKKREYFFWTRNGQRVGPLTEDEMRRRFDTRELSLDTPVALNVENEEPQAAQLQEYFPSVQDAFQTVPKINKVGDTMWVYLDDEDKVQGPFPGKQMRDWFQEGYFNEFSKVKLANSGDDLFVQLGLLFPEGEGAFLSEGDQAGAKAKQAEMDAQGPVSGYFDASGMTSPNTGSSMRFDGVTSPYDMNAAGSGGGMYGTDFSAPYDPNNPFGAPQSGGSGYDAYGGMSPAPPMPPPAQGAPWGGSAGSEAFPPYNAPQPGPDGGGKALLMRALSGEQRPGVPPALGGGAGGAPPPAMQPSTDDDWGVQWSDEEDLFDPSTRKDSEASAGEAHPLTVADMDDEDAPKPPKVVGYAELKKNYLSSVDALYLFLTRSLPKKLGTVRCKIKRSVVGLHVNYNLYEVFLEKDDGSLGPQIMCARKHRKFGIDSYYNLEIGSVNPREAGKVISALIFNSLGTNFVCHNNVSAHKGKPRDLCSIVYARNVGRGPRKFQVALPALKQGSETELVEWMHQGSVRRSRMLQALNTLDFPNLQPLVNKKPSWSKKHRAWVLNFHGRVTRSSVKNFQLVRPDNNDDVVLQFGRIGTDTFTMDMSWPISPVAALAVCVSSLHSKLAVE